MQEGFVSPHLKEFFRIPPSAEFFSILLSDTYIKFGDFATNLPSTVRFASNGVFKENSIISTILFEFYLYVLTFLQNRCIILGNNFFEKRG